MKEPFSGRKCPESGYDSLMVAVNIGTIRRNLAQTRKPALPPPQLALAMRSRLAFSVRLVLKLNNLGHLVGFGDVLLEEPPQSRLMKCGHSDAYK